MAPTARWLDDREQAAWRGFLTGRSKLISHLGHELQRQSGLSEAPGERLRLGELGERLDREKSRLSEQISRMSARGLVGREECETDDGRGRAAP